MGKSRTVSTILFSKVGNRVAVKLASDETITGRLLAVERCDGSLILSDAERERTTKSARNVIRTHLGFAVVRGSQVVSVNIHDSASSVGCVDHKDSLVIPAKPNEVQKFMTMNSQNNISNQNKSGGKVDFAKLMKEAAKKN